MRDCARFLFNHNPFYPLSAALVFIGLREAMQPVSASNYNAWWLAQSLAAYTLLLAVTAVIIIRFGKVWDDARTICLLVVLMFMAMSTSFDTLCVESPTTARALLASGWLFSMAVTEGLTRTAGFRFPLLYRLPYYGILALFFLFPLSQSFSMWETLNLSKPWRVLSFSSLAGILLLCLIPAIRRGASYVDNNGSPWRWPLYPWSVFFVVSIGIAGRSYLLTQSFQMDTGTQSTFGGYYLVPLVLSILILLAEIALVHKVGGLQTALLCSPGLLLLLAAIPGDSDAYEFFLTEVIHRIGSPLWLSLCLGLVYLTYLYLRGMRSAMLAMTPLLIGLVGIDSQTRVLSDYMPRHSWPVVAMALGQLVMLARKPSSFQFLVAWNLLLLSAVIQFRSTSFPSHGAVVPLHIVGLGAWIACVVFHDPLALYLRRRVPAITVGLATVGTLMWFSSSNSSLRMMLSVYIVALFVVMLMTWLLLRMKLWKWSLMAIAACITALGYSMLIGQWGLPLPSRAYHALVLGAASFVVGGSISAAKAGFSKCVGNWWQTEWQALVQEWNS